MFSVNVKFEVFALAVHWKKKFFDFAEMHIEYPSRGKISIVLLAQAAQIRSDSLNW